MAFWELRVFNITTYERATLLRVPWALLDHPWAPPAPSPGPSLSLSQYGIAVAGEVFEAKRLKSSVAILAQASYKEALSI